MNDLVTVRLQRDVAGLKACIIGLPRRPSSAWSNKAVLGKRKKAAKRGGQFMINGRTYAPAMAHHRKTSLTGGKRERSSRVQ